MYWLNNLFMRPTPKCGYPILGVPLYRMQNIQRKLDGAKLPTTRPWPSELFILSSVFDAGWECAVCSLAWQL